MHEYTFDCFIVEVGPLKDFGVFKESEKIKSFFF